MSRYRKLTTICCAAVFALGLAACGGGSDGVPQATHDDVASQLASLNAEIDALAAELGVDREDIPATVAALQAERNRLRGERDKAQGKLDEQATAAAVAAAEKLFEGLSKQRDADTANDFNAMDTGGNNAVITVTYGGVSKVTSGENAAIDEAEAKRSMRSEGWAVSEVMASDKAAPKNSDTVMVYSNRGMPTPKDATVANLGLNETGGDGSGVFAPAATTGWFSEAGDRNVQAPQFGTNSNAPIAIGDEDDTGETHTVRGTYKGASGGYVCAETGGVNSCTYQTGSTGIRLSTGWAFHLDAGEKVQVPDPTYSYFGWWLRQTSDDSYFVDTFSGGVQSPDWSDDSFNRLTGEAKYMGPATGKYAFNGIPGEYPSGGHFTATASLTADFESNVDGTSGNSISGKIDGFMAGDQKMDSWKITLKGQNIAAGGGTAANAVAVWEIGNHKGPDGVYTAQFRDQGTDGSPATVTGEWAVSYGYPATGTGTVNNIGHMIGAFGANKQ